MVCFPLFSYLLTLDPLQFLYILQEKAQLIVDEIDLNIYNARAVELISLFQDRKKNSKGAILMFTTYNLDLLNCFSEMMLLI